MRLRTPTYFLSIAVTAWIAWTVAKDTTPPPTPAVQANMAPYSTSLALVSKEEEPQPKHSARPIRTPAPSTRSSMRLQEDPTTIVVGTGEISATELVSRWAASKGVLHTSDKQLANVKIYFEHNLTLDRTALREVLDYHEVVLVTGHGDSVHALHRHNLSQMAGPPWDVVNGETPVDPDRIVTRIVNVYHGSGAAIFSTVRGLLTRDTNRVGNILYVSGSEQLILCDFARNVRYYEGLIHAMDVPAAEEAEGE